MDYLSRAVSSVSRLYNDINPATLSGSIDIVAVRGKDGQLNASPFHVRFGKLKLLRPGEKVVEVAVNGVATDLQMKVGEAGEAFFVVKTETLVPSEYATSPIPQAGRGDDDELEVPLSSLDLGAPATTLIASPPSSHQISITSATNNESSTIVNIHPISSSLSSVAVDYSPDVQRRISTNDNESVREERGFFSARGSERDRHEQNDIIPPSIIPEEGPSSSDINNNSIHEQLYTPMSAFPPISYREIRASSPSNPIPEDEVSPSLREGQGGESMVLDEQRQQQYQQQQYLVSNSADTTLILDEKPGRMPIMSLSDENIIDLRAASASQQSIPGDVKSLQPTGTLAAITTTSNNSPTASPFLQNTPLLQPSPAFRTSRSASTSNLSSPMRTGALDGAAGGTTKVEYPLSDHGMLDRSDDDGDVNDNGHGGVGRARRSGTSRRSTAKNTLPLSDTELEYSNEKNAPKKTSNAVAAAAAAAGNGDQSLSWSWGWGGFPVKHDDQGKPSKSSSSRKVSVNQQPQQQSSNNNQQQSSTKEPHDNFTGEDDHPIILDPNNVSMTVNEKVNHYLAGLAPPSPPPIRHSPISLHEDHASIMTTTSMAVTTSTSTPIVTSGHTHTTSTPSLVSSSTLLNDPVFLSSFVNFDVQVSVCGLREVNSVNDKDQAAKLFNSNLLSHIDLSENPLRLSLDPTICLRVAGKYMNWQTAGPVLLSLMVWKKPLTLAGLEKLEAAGKESAGIGEKSGSYSYRKAITQWFSSKPTLPPTTKDEKPGDIESQSPTKMSRVGGTNALQSPSSGSPPNLTLGGVPTSNAVTAAATGGVSASNIPHASSQSNMSDNVSDIISEDGRPMRKYSFFAKSLRLNSEQLESLNLKKGVNTITFTVTTKLQGKAVCSSKIFLWDWDTKVVISDVDGTITKSDALGHLFTMVGKDWTHSGVANLYSNIQKNGYKMLYLTSRAIGQSTYTRDYLKKVEQGQHQLPEGPIIMSPDRLFQAFHREVIKRKPEEFKIACLKDIKRLFGVTAPFYAGFGNRITDALSYRQVDVPLSRIFTIDPSGKIKMELLAGYESSYIKLNEMVDQIFPSINVSLNEQFNDWSFWKAPLLDLELGHLTPAERQLLNTPSPVAAAVSVATAAGNTIPSKSSSSSLLSSSAAAKAPTIGGSNNATMNSSVSSHSTTANTFSTSSKFTALARAAKGVNSSNNNPHLNSSDAAATGSTAVNEDGTPFSDTTQQSIFTSAFELDQGNEGDDEEGVGDGEEEDEYEDEYYEEEEEEDDFADVNVVKQNPATFL